MQVLTLFEWPTTKILLLQSNYLSEFKHSWSEPERLIQYSVCNIKNGLHNQYGTLNAEV